MSTITGLYPLPKQGDYSIGFTVHYAPGSTMWVGIITTAMKMMPYSFGSNQETIGYYTSSSYKTGGIDMDGKALVRTSDSMFVGDGK